VGWDHAVARIKTLDHIFALQKLPQNRAWGPDPRGLDPSDSGGLFGRPSSLAAISVARSPHPKIPFLADKALRLAPLRALSPVGLFVTIMSSSSDEALRKPLTAPTGVEVRDGAP
jgi:hypothetical protein